MPVARRILAEVPLPDAQSGSWEARLREVVAAIDAKLREHPDITEILLQRMHSTDQIYEEQHDDLEDPSPASCLT